MENNASQFIVKIAMTEKEKQQAFKLRYEEMVLAFCSTNTNAIGSDITEYDEFADQIVVIDQKIDMVVGCYRIVTNDKLLNNQKFLCEEEFNIDGLKNDNALILELSRAIVKVEYRNGIVLKLLWAFIFRYARENKINYVIGDASFAGLDPKLYKHCLSYLYYEYAVDDKFAIKSKQGNSTTMQFLEYEEIDLMQMKKELPSLIKAYLAFGARVAKEYYIDYEFGSVDVFVVIDMHNYNDKYVDKLLKL